MTDLFNAPDLSNERDELMAKWKDKTHEEVLKAKIDADLYVRTLEKQKDELRADYLKQREELLAKAKFEELIDRYEKAPKEPPAAYTPASEESHKYDPKEVETIILNKLKENKIAEKETDNFNMVEKKLQERYGDKYVTVLKEQQSLLGLSTDDVNVLAKKSPEAFFRIMGLNNQQSENFQTPPRSGQRNDSFAPKGQTKRDWSYYQEMKKANPKMYLEKNIAVQMHNDLMEMGEVAFYGNSL